MGERTAGAVAQPDRLGPLTRAEVALERHWDSLLQGRRRRHFSIDDVAGLIGRLGDVSLNRFAVPGAEVTEETVLLGRALNLRTREGEEAAITILAEQKRVFEGQVNHGGSDVDLDKARKRASICEKMIELLNRTMETR